MRHPKLVLREHALSPKKSFGQNFLIDQRVAEAIADLCRPDGGTVVELGAGLGALSRPLAARAARVIVVERDRDLVPVLRQELAAEIEGDRVEVLEADAKALDLEALFSGRPAPHVLCGNLPYQITGPLLTLSMAAAAQLSRAVFLVQLEVGERLVASAGSAAYGALSVFAQASFSIERARRLGPGAFYPEPGVASQVVVLTPLQAPTEESPTFRELVRSAFQKRRKTLLNAWRGVADLDEEGLRGAAGKAGVDLSARGETLGVLEFARMARAVDEAR